MSKEFRRTSSTEKIKLGKRNKRKQKWRRARGRHNKTREGVHGKPRKVQIGYRTPVEIRDKVDGKKPIYVANMKEAVEVEKNSLVILASIGRKKRMEIEKILKEKGIKIMNWRREKSRNSRGISGSLAQEVSSR